MLLRKGLALWCRTQAGASTIERKEKDTDNGIGQRECASMMCGSQKTVQLLPLPRGREWLLPQDDPIEAVTLCSKAPEGGNTDHSSCLVLWSSHRGLGPSL